MRGVAVQRVFAALPMLSHWPPASRCAAPQTLIKGKRGRRLTLSVGYLEGRKHLPVIELELAA